MSGQGGNGLPDEAASRSSAGLGGPLTPVERLSVRLRTEHHEDEADALLLLDPLFCRMLRDDGPYTRDGQELSDMLFEVVASWLPKGNCIVDDLDT